MASSKFANDLNVINGGILYTNVVSSYDTAQVLVTDSTRITSNSFTVENGSAVASIGFVASTLKISSTGAMHLLGASTTGITIDSSGNSSIEGSLSVTSDSFLHGNATIDSRLVASNGVHLLKNSGALQKVLGIQSTSTNGYSSVYCLDSSGTLVMNMGYGNTLLSAPYSGSAIIESLGGADLLVRSNGNTVFTSDTSGFTTWPGSMQVNGNIGLGQYLDLSAYSPGSTPTGTIKRFYLESGLLKSQNSSGTVTTYEPGSVKGDLTVHNGTTQVAFPVGTVNGQVLSVNSESSTGLGWTTPGDALEVDDSFFLSGTGYQVGVDVGHGSFISCLKAFVDGGPCGIFIATKSNGSTNGTLAQFGANAGTSVATKWSSYKCIEFSKSSPVPDGNYKLRCNLYSSTSTIVLTSTGVTAYKTNLVGACVLGIFPVVAGAGPCGTFIVSKQSSAATSPLVSTLSQDNNYGGIVFSWGASSGLSIRINNALYNGNYNVVDIFNSGLVYSVTLSGTSTVYLDAVNTYEKRAYFVKVSGPLGYGIYTCTKQDSSIDANIGSYNGSFGLYDLQWRANSVISVAKKSAGSDGTYKITLYS